ncbi:MAG: 4Fe-4S double cluster binding domain-containing protein [Lachnospiraceae bacterium]
MNNLTKQIVDEMTRQGADLVGVGSLLELPEDVRCGLPIGISIAMKFPKEIISGIVELPTQEYKNWYDILNERLDTLSVLCEDLLKKSGYQAIAQTRQYVGNAVENCSSLLPHKTVATRAGMGWIGKCALLVTKKYGSMIRLSSILTDAPLTVAEPINQSKCGGCTVCRDACPAGAVSGKEWNSALYRDEFYNPWICRDAAYERSKRGFGGNASICGKCIVVCPHTQKYIKQR